MRKVTMLDLKAELALYGDDVRRAIERVLVSQRFINGPGVEELETALAARVGASHAVAVSSGTDALLCALMALDIGPGDEVIVPTFTFFATAGAVVRVGATPVFTDIDPRTFNVDPKCVARAVGPSTKAIIVVHLFGLCASMEEIRTIARRNDLRIIEDAAQALGARRQRESAGTMGDVACLSFYPTKNLGGIGEGGMVFTQDGGLADRARQLRNHGESARYVHECVGGNFRLDTIKAGALLAKLPYLERFTERRRRNAGLYDQALAETPVTPPLVSPDEYHVYHQYSILSDHRDALAAHLCDRGVATGVYYPVPLHRQPCFAGVGRSKESLPVAEAVCKRILSLPCHPMLADEDIAYVARCIAEFGASDPESPARTGVRSDQGVPPAVSRA